MTRITLNRPNIEFHYFDHYKDLERGIGMCRAQATVLMKLMSEFGYDAGTWQTPVHVTAWVQTKNMTLRSVDPDPAPKRVPIL
jgi:hypothetical protein